MKHKLIKLLPVPIALLCAIGFVVVWFVGHEERSIKPVLPLVVPAYAPVSLREFRISVANKQITLYNGVCNSSLTTVSLTVDINARPSNSDALYANTVSLIKGQTVALPPGCLYTDPITGPLPPQLGSGSYVADVIIVVMGPAATNIQRISLTSNTFIIP